MTLRVVIADDEPPALERLCALFADLDGVEIAGLARNGREAAERIAQLKPDLVLLDIQMPEMSGLKVAADLPEENRPEIVFVTAFEHYAPDAFEVEAVDYLLKPVRFDRLRQALERARRRRAMRSAEQRLAQTQAPAPIAESCHEDAIWVDLPRGRVRVAVEDIEWIEAAKDYVLLHTAARSYIHRITMAALEEKIDPQALMRVHRSAFVRPSLVREIERLGKGLIALVMEGGVTVPVGPSYSKAVLERLRLA